MKFRKVLLSVLISVFVINFSYITSYAAEEVSVETENITVEDTIKTEEKIADSDESTIEADEKTAETDEKAIENDKTTEADQKAIETDTKATKADEKTTKAKETTQAKKQPEIKYTKYELRLLSALIYCEALGESYNGKLAVGIVVMNRVRANIYPDTVKGVIFQKYQFSPVNNGTLKKALAEYDKGNFTSASELQCIKAAKAALSGTKSITVNGKVKNFSKYLSFSGRLRGYTYKLGNHRFK